MNQHTLAPIFRPLRARFQPLGIPAMKALMIIGVVIVGVLLSVLLNYWTHDIETRLTDQERNQAITEYEYIAAQAASANEQINMAATEGTTVELTDTQKEILQEASELGITPSMTKEEIEAIVPLTHLETVPVIPLIVRLVLFVVLPAAALVVWYMEIHRTSLSKEFKRRVRYLQTPKIYRCAPREYVTRVAGTDYWEAISTVANGRDRY